MEQTWEKMYKSKFGLKLKISDLGFGRKRKDPYFELNKVEFLYIITKYSDEARAKLVMRWAELEEKNLIKIPTPKTYNGVKCIHYTSWLIQNGYSLMSGQVRGRIKKYPEQFRKGKDGWYMSEAIANYYINFKNPQQRISELPNINPNQLTLNFEIR